MGQLELLASPGYSPIGLISITRHPGPYMAHQAIRKLPDITAAIERALAANDSWQWGDYARRRKLITAEISAQVVWDEGSGERWARIVHGDKLLGLIWVKGPLAFIDTKAPPILKSFVKRGGTETDEVPDF